MGPDFLLRANLSGAGSLAQSAVITFHTQRGITLLLLQIIVENVVLHTITSAKMRVRIEKKKLVSVTERDSDFLFESTENVERCVRCRALCITDVLISKWGDFRNGF